MDEERAGKCLRQVEHICGCFSFCNKIAANLKKKPSIIHKDDYFAKICINIG
jgi:hypothetical protein